MQKVIRFVLVLSVPLLFMAFTPAKKEGIKWLSFTELKAAYAKNPKPIIIDVYTNWCGWCKVMDRETYSNAKVIEYINDKYYAVKFNAESTEAVEFAGKQYGYNSGYRSHDLAVTLLQGRMGYPTTVLLSAIDAQPAPLSGYMKPSELEPPLKFFGEGAYKTQDFPQFMKVFAAKW